MKLTEMTVKQLKTRKWIGEVAAFLLSVVPVSTVILSKWQLYSAEPAAMVRIGLGGIMVGTVVLMAVLDRLKIPGDIAVLAFIVILLWLLRTIVDDLLLLSFTLLCGRIGDRLLTSTYVKRIRTELDRRAETERAGMTEIDGVKSYLEGLNHE